MDSIQTLVWFSGTPIGRVLEHTDEEWLGSIGRQIRAEKEREKKRLDKKKQEYDNWTQKYKDYLKWCEHNNKKPSALSHLKYKFRNKTGIIPPWMRLEGKALTSPTPALRRGEGDKVKTGANKSAEKPKEAKREEQQERAEATSTVTSDGKSEPAMESPATKTVKSQQDPKNEKPQTFAEPTTEIATNTANTVKDESDDGRDTAKSDSEEVKTTPLTLEQEIIEMKKQIAILTMKVRDGGKVT